MCAFAITDCPVFIGCARTVGVGRDFLHGQPTQAWSGSVFSIYLSAPDPQGNAILQNPLNWTHQYLLVTECASEGHKIQARNIPKPLVCDL